eukprot:1017884-Alexandrium_andersonii.AAC.1
MTELITLSAKHKGWAKQVPQPNLQHPALKKWIEDPKVDTLAEAVAKAYNDMYHWGRRRRERKALGDESSGSGEGAAADDSSAA